MYAICAYSLPAALCEINDGSRLSIHLCALSNVHRLQHGSYTNYPTGLLYYLTDHISIQIMFDVNGVK